MLGIGFNYQHTLRFKIWENCIYWHRLEILLQILFVKFFNFVFVRFSKIAKKRSKITIVGHSGRNREYFPGILSVTHRSACTSTTSRKLYFFLLWPVSHRSGRLTRLTLTTKCWTQILLKFLKLLILRWSFSIMQWNIILKSFSARKNLILLKVFFLEFKHTARI